MAEKIIKKASYGVNLRLTIDPEVFKEWKKQRKFGDGGKLATLCDLSAPTIDAALNYGFLSNKNLANGVDIKISNFFAERVKLSKRKAEKQLSKMK